MAELLSNIVVTVEHEPAPIAELQPGAIYALRVKGPSNLAELDQIRKVLEERYPEIGFLVFPDSVEFVSAQALVDQATLAEAVKQIAVHVTADEISEPVIDQIREGVEVLAREQEAKAPKPGIGRIVHYFPRDREFGMYTNSTSPVAAVITAVLGDSCVNLKILADGPHDYWRTSVMLRSQTSQTSEVWGWPARS